jgi:hypothetical protein
MEKSSMEQEYLIVALSTGGFSRILVDLLVGFMVVVLLDMSVRVSVGCLRWAFGLLVRLEGGLLTCWLIV